jgi:hypothetical protein
LGAVVEVGFVVVWAESANGTRARAKRRLRMGSGFGRSLQ